MKHFWINGWKFQVFSNCTAVALKEKIIAHWTTGIQWKYGNLNYIILANSASGLCKILSKTSLAPVHRGGDVFVLIHDQDLESSVVCVGMQKNTLSMMFRGDMLYDYFQHWWWPQQVLLGRGPLSGGKGVMPPEESGKASLSLQPLGSWPMCLQLSLKRHY